MTHQREIIRAHITREDLDSQPLVITYLLMHLPRIGDEIKVSAEDSYVVTSVVWRLDDPVNFFYTEVDIGVRKADETRTR